MLMPAIINIPASRILFCVYKEKQIPIVISLSRDITLVVFMPGPSFFAIVCKWRLCLKTNLVSEESSLANTNKNQHETRKRKKKKEKEKKSLAGYFFASDSAQYT